MQKYGKIKRSTEVLWFFRSETDKALLEEFTKKKGLQITGEDIFAKYDPPFQIWFLKRNEVLFPVE